MDAAHRSLPSLLQQISLKWLVGILLLISMALQLVLIVLGMRRYHSSRAFFNFVVWGAYISADAVAISALGSMMHHSAHENELFGIWAPVLLLHLGGPDAITAYSVADNELWLRHGFNMVYQVSVAIFVIYSSPLKDSALASAVLLLVAGATKYGERTLALWFASDSQIVTSCLPISRYMKQKSVVQNHGYVVMGEGNLPSKIKKKTQDSSMEGSGINAGQEASSPKGKAKKEEAEASSSTGIASLEASSSKERDIEEGQEASSLGGGDKEAWLKEIVTTVDVEKAGINEENYNLCLSHALSKIYMRRFVSLHFDEGDWNETREFWFKFNGKRAFGIVEKELKFMYDMLFSKGSGTAFSRYGILLRILNCLLMGAAGFLILKKREREEREREKIVTYIVISVALVVEVFQFCQIMASDWTRVRLICAQVEEIRYPFTKVIEIAVLVLEKVQKVVGGDIYWSNGIHQHCLMGTCLDMPRSMWKMVKFIPKADIYIPRWYVGKVSVQEELKEFLFERLKLKCCREYDIATCWDNIYYFEEDLLENESEIRGIMPSHDSLEELILVWHIATTICDRKRVSAKQGENEKVQRSIILSRYCAYLLVSYPRLLPVHPEMARITYKELVDQLMGKEYHGKDPTELLDCSDQSVLGCGAQLARKLLEKEETPRWDLLANYWAELVIYMAVYNKAAFHAECMAGGGEFLSQVWVLLGHMGCGEQSDSAVRKKKESLKEEDKRERLRIKGNRQGQVERKRVEREQEEREHKERERAKDSERERTAQERERSALEYMLTVLERK